MESMSMKQIYKNRMGQKRLHMIRGLHWQIYRLNLTLKNLLPMKSFLCFFLCLLSFAINTGNPQGIAENNNKFASADKPDHEFSSV